MDGKRCDYNIRTLYNLLLHIFSITIKKLATGPKGNSYVFVFALRPPMFPEAKQKGTGTFRVEEQQNSLFLFGRVIKVNTFYV